MVVSLQRMIAIAIMLNIVMILAGNMYANTYEMQESADLAFANQLNSYNLEYAKYFGNITPDTGTYIDKQFGDANYGGTHWYSLLGGGAPFGWIDKKYSQNSPEELRAINFFNTIISALYLLLGFEGFLLFYAKKVT